VGDLRQGPASHIDDVYIAAERLARLIGAFIVRVFAPDKGNPFSIR
jgi:hypothetical protein